MHLGQVADVDGMGAALVFEDMEFSNSDRDYQDIVFQIGEPSGIVPRFVSLVRGDLPLLGTMLGPGKEDWPESSDSPDREIMEHLERPWVGWRTWGRTWKSH